MTKALGSLLLLLVSAHAMPAGGDDRDDPALAVLESDRAFWKAYNQCDVPSMGGFFTEDAEFYHDRGGVTLWVAAIVATTRDNLCGKPDWRLRREAVEGTVRVFPLKKADSVYGAILSGEHLFYVLEKGKAERADGKARFTHLWLRKDGAWKMARVLSYDHGPAPYVSARTAVALADSALDRYVGSYRAPESGDVKVEKGSGVLILAISDQRFSLHPEKDGLFFSKERDLTFEFIRDDKGRVAKLVVRERGEVAEEAVRTE